MDEMTYAKLWDNPCGLAFRLNYLALRYNTPCYDWVQREHGLSRIEYVIVYSLALHPGGQARDIARSSGFPKNSLSRAIAKLEVLKIVKRQANLHDKREQSLFLTARGKKLFDKTLPMFERRELQMTECLNSNERQQLSNLLAKVVGHCVEQPDMPNGHN
jgi:DNA-binding MarR family transcriptional regulator